MRPATLIFAAALLSLSSASLARAEVFVVGDGGTVSADISLQHPTRVSFKHDAGSQLIFNQPEGAQPEISATVSDSGDVFLSVVQGASGQSLTGYVTTAAGATYQLELSVRAGKSEHIEILGVEAQDRYQKAQAATALASAPEKAEMKPVKWGRSSASYQGDVVELFKVLYFRQAPAGFKKVKQKHTLSVGDAQTARVVQLYRAENVEALELVVTNSGGAAVDPSFLQPGFGDSIAIGFMSDNVAPGGSTRVFVLRNRVQ